MTAAPKKTRWWKTALKAAVFLVVLLVTLAVLFAATLSFLGRRDWARVKAELIARGERLSFSEMHPAPIPDSQNFFANPMWAELTDLVEVEKEVEGQKFREMQIRLPEGKRQIDGLNRPLTADERAALRAAFPDRKVPDNARAADQVRSAYQAGLKLEAPANRRNAEYILAVLPFCDPVLARLDELGQRPGAWLPMEGPDAVLSTMSRITRLMSYAQLLAARSWAELTLGKNEEARRDTIALLRLPEVLANHPLFITFLVRVPLKNLGIDAVAGGLKARAWSDRDLAEIERALAGADYPVALALSLRGERGWGNQIFERIYRNTGSAPYEEMWSGPLPSAYLWVFGPGEDARRNTIYQNSIDVLDKVPSEGLNARTFVAWDSDRKALQDSGWNRFRYRITAAGLTDVTKMAREAAYLQDRISQARVAVALERYRLRYGEYPETLDSIVPEFLPAMPLDLVTLKPFLYRREAGDTFVLWSVGWNETDENGRRGMNAEGDWVWEK